MPGMDYLDLVKYRRHDSWEDFLHYRAGHPEEYGRLVLLTTHASKPYTEFEFLPNDIILMGRKVPACRRRFMTWLTPVC